jgi:hypothetical protein
MKHPTEKPAEQVMRFFTTELYVLFNSPDDEVADRANEEWERALQAYKRHLDTMRDRMPSQVRKVAELSLHDAEVLGMEFQSLSPLPEQFGPTPLWSAMAILSLKQDRTIQSLIYTLWDRVREYPAQDGWRFSKTRKHWLYDEVDITPDRHGTFLHRILFSDGAIVEIPFVSAIINTVNLPVAEDASKSRRIA